MEYTTYQLVQDFWTINSMLLHLEHSRNPFFATQEKSDEVASWVNPPTSHQHLAIIILCRMGYHIQNATRCMGER